MTTIAPPRREVRSTCIFCTPWSSSWPMPRALIATGISMPANRAPATEGHQSSSAVPPIIP